VPAEPTAPKEKRKKRKGSKKLNYLLFYYQIYLKIYKSSAPVVLKIHSRSSVQLIWHKEGNRSNKPAYGTRRDNF
jgi:hypothetical protein